MVFVLELVIRDVVMFWEVSSFTEWSILKVSNPLFKEVNGDPYHTPIQAYVPKIGERGSPAFFRLLQEIGM